MRDNLESLSLVQLRQMAKDAGLKGMSSKKKAELIEILSSANVSVPASSAAPVLSAAPESASVPKTSAASVSPAVSEVPAATKAPAASEVPAATKAPAASEVPAAIKAPAAPETSAKASETDVKEKTEKSAKETAKRKSASHKTAAKKTEKNEDRPASEKSEAKSTEKPAEEKSGETKITEMKPAEEKTAETKSAESSVEKPVSEKTSQDESAQEKPAEAVKPADPVLSDKENSHDANRRQVRQQEGQNRTIVRRNGQRQDGRYIVNNNNNNRRQQGNYQRQQGQNTYISRQQNGSNNNGRQQYNNNNQHTNSNQYSRNQYNNNRDNTQQRYQNPNQNSNQNSEQSQQGRTGRFDYNAAIAADAAALNKETLQTAGAEQQPTVRREQMPVSEREQQAQTLSREEQTQTSGREQAQTLQTRSSVREQSQISGREQAQIFAAEEPQSGGVAKVMEEKASVDSGMPAHGILEVMPDGFGFIRSDNFLPGDEDVYVAPSQIHKFRLKTGDFITGSKRIKSSNEKFAALIYITAINDVPVDQAVRRPNFEDLTPVFPNERIHLERPGGSTAVRIVDLLAPVGKGQRGMIASQPKAGKTTLLKDIALSVLINHPDMHVIILLIDERPEEVTDFKEFVKGTGAEVIHSTFDETPEHHCKVSEMVLERAKRLVEHGRDVMILLDSITRLARAYNLTVQPSGRTLSGGLDPGALHMPKKFFGAARNMREGGSLTILATALVETGSRMDDVVFEEFKGTGNMELVLNRKLSEKRIFPAIDIAKSGTRREDLLLTPEEVRACEVIRRALNGPKAEDSLELLLDMFKHTKDNAELCGTAPKIKWNW